MENLESISKRNIEKAVEIIVKLKIKEIWESEQRKEKFPRIDIYQAVIDEGIKTFKGFKTWNNNSERDTISMWEPNVESIKKRQTLTS